MLLEERRVRISVAAESANIVCLFYNRHRYVGHVARGRTIYLHTPFFIFTCQRFNEVLLVDLALDKKFNRLFKANNLVE